MCASRATRRYDADASTPLPWGCVGAVFLAQLAQGVQLNSLFPLLVFMVRDWQVAAGSLDADVSDPSVARQAGRQGGGQSREGGGGQGIRARGVGEGGPGRVVRAGDA